MKKILREMTCVESYNRIFLHGRRYEKNERDGKPGSVADDHLSRTAVAGSLKQPTCAKDGPPCAARLGFASDGACTAAGVTTGTVSSCLAFSPLLSNEQGMPCSSPSGYSLLRYPGSRLRRTLSGILPCEARTFLPCTLVQRRSSVPLIYVKIAEEPIVVNISQM